MESLRSLGFRVSLNRFQFELHHGPSCPLNLDIFGYFPAVTCGVPPNLGLGTPISYMSVIDYVDIKTHIQTHYVNFTDVFHADDVQSSMFCSANL